MKQKNNLLLPVAAGFVLATFSGLTYGQAAPGPTGLLRAKKPIPNNYIVVLKQTALGPGNVAAAAAATARNLAIEYGGRLGFTYQHAFPGFSVLLSEAQALALTKDPRVAYVEEDSMASATATQTPVSWNLDRIDQRQGTNGYYDYIFTGAGVHAYVLDTGVRPLADFGGRVIVDPAADFVPDGRNGDDCNGHGTWVAGILGGNKYGVAKGVTIHSVRVLDCAGSAPISRVIAGVDWVTGHKIGPAVANMSLIAPANLSLDQVVRNSIAAGVTYVVGAGNDNVDAGAWSPARVAEAITVGASDWNDYRWPNSNYGAAVDLFAPGVSIPAYTNTGSFYASDGTSAASPHVAGVAAQFLQANPSAPPVAVVEAIRTAATKNIVGNPGAGSPNALVFTNFPSSTVAVAGQEQYECIPSATRECASIVWDAGTVTITVSGRSYTTSYGRSSTKTIVASALASGIAGDPAVTAWSSGSTINVVSRGFSCYAVTATSASSKPSMFSPSFTATPTAPYCQ